MLAVCVLLSATKLCAACDGFYLEGLGSELALDQSLYRTPSRLAITYENVYRIPQTEIQVVSSIGEGTFGEVVLASNEVFGRVAVKWLKVGLNASPCGTASLHISPMQMLVSALLRS